MSPHRYAIGAIFLLIPFIALSTIIHVPGSHSTIQAAIDAASDGDTVLIADGTYSGSGNIGIEWDATVKHLVIMSENGRDHCIIDCKEEDRGFLLNNGQDHRDVIDGLAITNGWHTGSGGAICIAATSPRIMNCMLANNTSYATSGNYNGGGAIMVYGEGSPHIQGNIIRNNFSNTSGGGIYISHTASEIINNTIAYNSTGNESYGGHGGGIAISKWSPYPVIRNCIIWYNVAGPSSMNIDFDPMEWLDISYCNVQEDLGHIFDLEPHTNIDAPPEFVDPENGDFQLKWGSPCTIKGNPDTTGLNLPLMDLSGGLRIFEDTVDIGAYEFNRPTDNPAIVNSEGFKIYPNPSSGLSALDYRGHEKHDDLLMRIFNLQGEIVKEEMLDAAENC